MHVSYKSLLTILQQCIYFVIKDKDRRSENMKKKNNSLGLRIDGDQKRQLLEAISKDPTRSRNMSSLIVELIDAYVELIGRASGRKPPLLRLEGFNNLRQDNDCPSVKKLTPARIFISPRRELKVAEPRVAYGHKK